jgi:hypothetical protein
VYLQYTPYSDLLVNKHKKKIYFFNFFIKTIFNKIYK